MENYKSTITLKADASKVFTALTQKIHNWWTEMFEGAANKEGAEFTVRFGDSVYKTMQIAELVPNAKVVWYVKASLIDIPELKNKTEWVGTTIAWELKEEGETTLLQLEHIGLNEAVECYDICSNGWQQFTHSLKLYVETGTGNPFKNLS
ncbi:MAG: SRPBCC domain-containing protein [Pedobacter sp.]|uniref:SRPBCC family protein n=1 Tax=Pedobacter sp. TaxID=1411316 RepID=UPI002807DAF9|nr:SRPBCC domain-containing protein [Pedobacter sp.]MDQ8005819.1 SRPBCC domain-containing protein [Pedobacter sp.]